MMTSLLKRSMRMAKLALLASAVMSPALMADSNLPISTPVTVTLANGVKVLLKPDHSWEYQLDAPDTAASQVTSGNTIPTSAAIPVTAAVAPVGSASVGSTPVDSASVRRGGDSSDSIAVSSSARQAQPASRLNDSALANPQLLSEGHRDGLVARLAEVNVEDDEAVLRFELDNTAGQSIIGVQAKLRLYADDGRLLATREVPLWVGEYRLPQTYLRPGQTRDSREVRVTVPEGEWSHKLVRVEVTEVEFR
jgi:hypothetical protein